jgi:DnaK suppressor protein
VAKASLKKPAAKGGAKSKLTNHKAAKKAAPPRPVAVAKRKPTPVAKTTTKQATAAGKSVKVGSVFNSKATKHPAPVAAKAPPAANNKSARSKERDPDRRGIMIPAPVPTDMKPAKNRVGLRSSELEHFRDLLLAKRRELVGDMSSMEREALNRGGSSNLSNLPMHMADMGTDNYEQEFTLGLMEKDRNLLREINSALAKIQDGSYGICEGTGLPISKPRLEAQPWAKFSIEHARKMEQRGVR